MRKIQELTDSQAGVVAFMIVTVWIAMICGTVILVSYINA